jgi:hypothetical protein
VIFVFLTIPVLALIALAIVIGQVARARAPRTPTNEDPESLSLDSAAYVARAIQLRANVTIGTLAALGVVASVAGPVWALIATTWPVLVGFAAAAALWLDEAYRLRRLLRCEGVAATLLGKFVTVTAGHCTARLRASAALIARARCNAFDDGRRQVRLHAAALDEQRASLREHRCAEASTRPQRL